MCYGVKIYLRVHYVQTVLRVPFFNCLADSLKYILILFGSVFTSEQFFDKEL
jgi:hypothetical protein